MFGDGEPVGWSPTAGPSESSGGGGVVPSENDVRLGVVFDVGLLPVESNVRLNVIYG